MFGKGTPLGGAGRFGTVVLPLEEIDGRLQARALRENEFTPASACAPTPKTRP